jgi:hypothetical protein
MKPLFSSHLSRTTPLQATAHLGCHHMLARCCGRGDGASWPGSDDDGSSRGGSGGGVGSSSRITALQSRHIPGGGAPSPAKQPRFPLPRTTCVSHCSSTCSRTQTSEPRRGVRRGALCGCIKGLCARTPVLCGCSTGLASE